MRATAATITVVGSLNIDVITTVPRLPAPGETVGSTSLTRRQGGKGANQALAAARQGARVTMIGCVGDDAEGRSYMDHLRREKITVSTMKTIRGEGTGTALIAVDASGENQIIVHPGANGHVTAPTVRTQRARIAVASALLIQFEVPMEAVRAAIEIANESSVPVVLNPSPPVADFPWGELKIDVLIVNESEAEAVFDRSPDDLTTQTDSWVELLQEKKIQSLIVTRGPKSTLALHQGKAVDIPRHPVDKPIDSVGAGDTFAGSFTAQHFAGRDFEDALRWANTAAALSIVHQGAQEGIPFVGDVIAALGDQA